MRARNNGTQQGKVDQKVQISRAAGAVSGICKSNTGKEQFFRRVTV
jgi:hypothetical protein